ncbi:MAG: hypothetical protein L6R36_003269 [Xanthoria steineri]|nr:MAG: hypothetical protein L6R36_003269 [Xanthoria steineri]
MDMRNLHTSLPRSTSSQQPPEQLLQAFKSAALSVTNLYKTAAFDQARARQNGYQEALDDILTFLDKEHLGLGDGEGWRVRQWATERLDGNTADRTAVSESDDERAETEKRARSSSPVVPYKSSTVDVLPRASKSPARVTSAPPVPQESPLPPTSHPKSTPEIFSFRSSHPYPQDVDMGPSESTTTASTADNVFEPEIQNIQTIPQHSPTLRVGVLPRAARTPHRNTSSHANRHNTRGSTFTSRRSLGTGAGSKRRFDLNEYFDVGNLGEPREGGGGKKGRFS